MVSPPGQAHCGLGKCPDRQERTGVPVDDVLVPCRKDASSCLADSMPWSVGYWCSRRSPCLHREPERLLTRRLNCNSRLNLNLNLNPNLNPNPNHSQSPSHSRNRNRNRSRRRCSSSNNSSSNSSRCNNSNNSNNSSNNSNSNRCSN